MQTPSLKSVCAPDTPGRRLGERVALLISARKMLNDIPVQKADDKQEEK